MTSKLASLAKVVFSAKAAAARSAPSAIVGPLQKIFGTFISAEEENVEEEGQQQHQEEEGILEATLPSSDPTNTNQELVGFVSALASTRTTVAAAVAPIDNPFAIRRELRKFQQDYYRRAIASTERQTDESFIQDPDLSIPVEDEHLYLAQ